jgi:vacuolar protein sorting-associated protein 18
MLLATWLVEFYSSKINTLDDIIASKRALHDVDNLKAENAILEDDLKAFFETCKVRVNKCANDCCDRCQSSPVSRRRRYMN